jgi:hypothetical protein
MDTDEIIRIIRLLNTDDDGCVVFARKPTPKELAKKPGKPFKRLGGVFVRDLDDALPMLAADLGTTGYFTIHSYKR